MAKDEKSGGSLAGMSAEEFARLLEDIKASPTFKNPPIEERFPYHQFEKHLPRLMPLTKQRDGEISPFDIYFSKEITDIGQGVPQRTANCIYHGTSLEALDMMIESGWMLTARELFREGKLVSGELFEEMERTGDKGPGGPKWMPRKWMVERGMIKPDDPHFYSFGGVDDLFFDSLMGAHSYTHKDPAKKAIVGLNKKALEFRGETFINTTTSAGSEGLIHEGPLSILIGLSHILVPADRVREYEEKTQAKYLVRVEAIE
jgi:hypothetical protein